MDRIDARPASPQVTARLSAEASARLDSLFREHNSFVVNFAAKLLGDRDAAQDIAQTVWLSLVPSMLRGDEITSPRSYLASRVRSRIIDYRRPKQRRSEVPTDWTDATASPSLPVSPAPDVVSPIEVLDALSPVQAGVLKLASQGLSHTRIAARLGRTRQAVDQVMARNARNLRALALAG